MRARDREVMFQIGKERYRLECFAETLYMVLSGVCLMEKGIYTHHLISKNTI